MKQKLAMSWQQWGIKSKSSFGFRDNGIHKWASSANVTSNCNLLFKKGYTGVYNCPCPIILHIIQ